MLVISSSFPSLWGKLIWKMFLVVIFATLGLFVNTLTVVDKDPLQNCEILSLPVQMQLSKKTRKFFGISCSMSGDCIKF